MRGPKPPGPAWHGLALAAAITAVVAVALIVLGDVWPNHAPRTRVTDASVMIGTFITIYTAFIAGFGVLVGFVAGRNPKWLAATAIALIVVGTAVDLWRVIDSTGDLYRASTTGLTYHQLNDDVHDFKAYFCANVLVVAAAVGVAVACRPRATPVAEAAG